MCTCELAGITEHSESVVSQHLRVLRQLRLVTSRRSGRRVFYRLQDTPLRCLLTLCLDHAGSAPALGDLPWIHADETEVRRTVRSLRLDHSSAPIDGAM